MWTIRFSGGLTLQGSAVLNADQTLTYIGGNLTANGVIIQPGTYSGASLFDLGANFDDGGGTLVVSAFPDTAGPNELPETTDFDKVGLTDAEEYADGVIENQTDPTDPDDDNLLGGPEFAGTNNSGVPTGFGLTDPFNPDSDGDGFTDGVEVRYGSNPNNDSLLSGDAVPIVDGGFESPILPVFGEGLGVASGTDPWPRTPRRPMSSWSISSSPRMDWARSPMSK